MPLTIEQQRAIAIAQAKRKRAEAEGQSATPAGPSLRSETDAIIEEAAANIPGGFAAFDAKPADPKRMAAMGYVPDPLAKSGYAKPRAPEAPIVDSGNTTNAFTDIARGLEAPIAGVTGGALEGWAKTTSQDPVRGASEAVDFISPVDDLGRAYQGVKQAGAGLIEGDMGKAAEGAQQASIQGSYAAMQMLPGSMTLKGVTGRAAPTTMAGAERAAVQASRAPQVVKPQAKPEPVITPPSEAPKPFSAPPEPIGRGVVRRNLDRIVGGGVGATLGGTGDAMAAPGDGDSGGLPGGAATGAAIGIFGPRAIAAASSRGFRAAARMAQSPTARAGFDERVASRAVRKALLSGGIKSEQDALNAARAKFGDKPASVADLTQEGVSTTAGISRLPGATGEAARSRGEDLIQTRGGRLERDIGGATGASPATIAGDVDRMVELAREQATPAYNSLKVQFPTGSLASPRLTQLGEIEALAPHTKAVDGYRKTVQATEGRAVGDFEYWDLVKRDIDAKEQQLLASGATLDDIRVRKLEDTRSALVEELDKLMPDYPAARQLGGEAPKMNAAFKQGQGLLGGRYTAEDVSRVAESVTGQPLTALQAGVIRSMVGKTEGAGGAVASLTSAGARKKLERVFGKGPADEMQARFKADASIVQNASRMNPNVGSVTSQAEMGAGGILPTAADLIRMGTNPMQTALAAMSKSGSYTKAQRDLMGQMLLEGVTPENVARIFAGKKPKGGGPTPAAPTTGLGGPASSASASPTSTGLGTSAAKPPEKAGFGGKSLPMDEPSRMQRAREQGFDTGTRWYHGTARLDRLLEKPGIDPKRATSGPMPFFTDDPAMASSYAMGKKGDTSMPDYDVTQSFTVEPKHLGHTRGRTPYSVEQSWNFLAPEQKRTILDRAKRVGWADPETSSGPLKLHPEGVDASPSSSHFDWLMKTEARGNPITALRMMWHDGGILYGAEDQLKEVFKLAGYPHPVSTKNAPWTKAEGVLPVYMRMSKPLQTDNAAELQNVITQLRQDFARDRSVKKPYGADMWDKSTRHTPREWVEQLAEDVAKGENSFVWTSIPDKVTDALKRMGYDGILDTGGKMGGNGHRVAIPFSPTNVRSINAKFDPSETQSSKLLAGVSGLTGLGVISAGATLPKEDMRKKKAPAN